jgi:hypothetical protein
MGSGMSVLVLAEHDNAVLKDATLAAVKAATRSWAEMSICSLPGRAPRAGPMHKGRR